jgi:hypothetical protein
MLINDQDVVFLKMERLHRLRPIPRCVDFEIHFGDALDDRGPGLRILIGDQNARPLL